VDASAVEWGARGRQLISRLLIYENVTELELCNNPLGRRFESCRAHILSTIAQMSAFLFYKWIMNFRKISYDRLQKLAINQIKVLSTYDPGQDVDESFEFIKDLKISSEEYYLRYFMKPKNKK